MKLWKLTGLVTVFVLTSSANAALVKGVLQGVVAENAQVWGVGEDVFGLDGAGLSGESFIINFTYDTRLAPLIADLGPDIVGGARTTYQSTEDFSQWLEMSITINAHKYDVKGYHQTVDIMDYDSSHPFNTNNPYQTDSIQLATSSYSEFDGISYRSQYLNIGLDMPNDILSSSSFLLDFETSEIVRSWTFFNISEFDRDPTTGEVLYERHVEFDLDVYSIETSVVPLPAAAWLFGSGLIGLVGVARRKKYKNSSNTYREEVASK